MAKSSAAERTGSLFAGPTLDPDRPAEYLEPEAKEGARVPLEADTDRLRDNAYKGQEWADKHFGKPEAEGNTYRLSLRAGTYYLERLSKVGVAGGVYGYTGWMLHEADLFGVTNLMVQAARAKKEKEK